MKYHLHAHDTGACRITSNNCCRIRLKVAGSVAGTAGKPGTCVMEAQDIVLRAESRRLSEWSKSPALDRVRKDGTWRRVSGLWECPLRPDLEMQVISLACQPFHNEQRERFLRVQCAEMLITIRYSSRHSSTSSEYVWHQWELIKYTCYSTAVEYYCSTAFSDQSESWSPRMDASQIYPNSHFQKWLGNIPLIERLKENGILIFWTNR